MTRKPVRVWLAWCLCTVLVLITPGKLPAHAILVEASPQSGSTVSGSEVPIRLRFNVRVDGERSRIAIAAAPKGTTKPLTLDKQTTPDVLTAKATGLCAGKYTLEWQVLAADGHITRGELSFTVQ